MQKVLSLKTCFHRSKRFAFIVFIDPTIDEKVLLDKHTIDGWMVLLFINNIWIRTLIFPMLLPVKLDINFPKYRTSINTFLSNLLVIQRYRWQWYSHLQETFNSLRVRMRYVAGRSSLKGNIKREFDLKISAVKDMWQSVKSILQKGQQIHRWKGRWQSDISFPYFQQ